MDKITRFPDSMQRQWRIFEADVRPELMRQGLDPEGAAYVLRSIKGAYLRCASAREFSSKQDLSDWVRQVTNEFLVELVTCHAELYSLRGGTKEPPGKTGGASVVPFSPPAD